MLQALEVEVAAQRICRSNPVRKHPAACTPFALILLVDMYGGTVSTRSMDVGCGIELGRCGIKAWCNPRFWEALSHVRTILLLFLCYSLQLVIRPKCPRDRSVNSGRIDDCATSIVDCKQPVCVFLSRYP